MLLIGVLAAAAASLPQPHSFPMVTEAEAAASHGVAYAHTLTVVVSPAGGVISCKVLASDEPRSEEACARLTSFGFTPARDADGRPVFAVLTFTFTTTAGGGPAIKAKWSDVDLTLRRMPDGAALHPVAELALTVKPDGAVARCDVVASSGLPILDALACKTATETTLKPLTAPGAGPVTSVQSFNVGFAALTPFTSKTSGQYSRFGAPGPYFPDRAARMSISGSAFIACSTKPDGALTDCAVDEEQPVGQAFGLTALKMASAQWIRVAPGSPSRVLLQIEFKAH